MTTPDHGRNGVRVEVGDCIEVMRAMPRHSVDAVVTDPPYGLEFMGKEWDSPWKGDRRQPGDADYKAGPDVYGRTTDRYGYGKQIGPAFQEWCEAWAKEALRVLKPGGHLLAFGGTRMAHRLASGVEDAGFEVRDTIAWMYGTGFPKSMNVGDGRGTALKPAHEPVVVARKALTGTVATTVAEHGTGALNIDACRVDLNGGTKMSGGCAGTSAIHGGGITDRAAEDNTIGRWPANVVLDRDAAAQLDEQTESVIHGGGSRFFYVAKPDNDERNAGLGQVVSLFAPDDAPDRNDHPTVKPIDLMRWLCRLVTPPGGTVLDPFTGSGTTGCAAALEGFGFIGIEREPAYASIARARLAHWALEAAA